MQFAEHSDDGPEARRPTKHDAVHRVAGAMPAKAERVLGALDIAPAPRETRDRPDHNDVDRPDVSLAGADDKLTRAQSDRRDFVGPLNAASPNSRMPHHVSRCNTLPRYFTITTAPVTVTRRIGNDYYDPSHKLGTSLQTPASTVEDMAWSRLTGPLHELPSGSFPERASVPSPIAISRSPTGSGNVVISPDLDLTAGGRQFEKLDAAHEYAHGQAASSRKDRSTTTGIQEPDRAGTPKARLTGLRRLTEKRRFRTNANTGTTLATTRSSTRRNIDIDPSPRTKIHVRRPPKNIKNWFDGFEVSSDDEYDDEEVEDDRKVAVELGGSELVFSHELPAVEPPSFRNPSQLAFGLTASSTSPNMYSTMGRGSQQHFTHAYHSSEDVVQGTDQDSQRVKDLMNQAMQRRHHIEMSQASSTQSSSEWDDPGDSSSIRRLLSLTDAGVHPRSSSELEGGYEMPQSRRVVHRAITVPVTTSEYGPNPRGEILPWYDSPHHVRKSNFEANVQVPRPREDIQSRFASPGANQSVTVPQLTNVGADGDSRSSTPLLDGSHLMAVTSEEMTLLEKIRQQRAAAQQNNFTEGYQLVLKREQEHLARRRHSAQQTASMILQMKEERVERVKEARTNKIESLISDHAEQQRRIMLLQQENEHKALKLEKFLLQGPGTAEQSLATRSVNPEPRRDCEGAVYDVTPRPEVLSPDVYSPRSSNKISGPPQPVTVSQVVQVATPPRNLEEELERGYRPSLLAPTQAEVWQDIGSDLTTPPPYEEVDLVARLRSPGLFTATGEKSAASYGRRFSFSNDGQSFDQHNPQNPHAIELPANEPVLKPWTESPRGRDRYVAINTLIDENCLVSPITPNVKESASSRTPRSLSTSSIAPREPRHTAIFAPALQATESSPSSSESRSAFAHGRPETIAKLRKDLSDVAKDQKGPAPPDLMPSTPTVPSSANRASAAGMVSASQEVSAAWVALGGDIDADGDGTQR